MSIETRPVYLEERGKRYPERARVRMGMDGDRVC